jgi:4-hydroxy-tetrahydrodipicolinate synthase
MCQKFFDGDIAGSREIQYKAIKPINALFMEVNPIPVKTALKYIGIEAGPMRMPLTEMEPEHAEVLKKEMEAFGLLK